MLLNMDTMESRSDSAKLFPDSKADIKASVNESRIESPTSVHADLDSLAIVLNADVISFVAAVTFFDACSIWTRFTRPSLWSSRSLSNKAISSLVAALFSMLAIRLDNRAMVNISICVLVLPRCSFCRSSNSISLVNSSTTDDEVSAYAFATTFVSARVVASDSAAPFFPSRLDIKLCSSSS